MDESSFIGFDYKNAMKMILSNPKTALFGSIGSTNTQDDYKSCQVLCDKIIEKINIIFFKRTILSGRKGCRNALV